MILYFTALYLFIGLSGASSSGKLAVVDSNCEITRDQELVLGRFVQDCSTGWPIDDPESFLECNYSALRESLQPPIDRSVVAIWIELSLKKPYCLDSWIETNLKRGNVFTAEAIETYSSLITHLVGFHPLVYVGRLGSLSLGRIYERIQEDWLQTLQGSAAPRLQRIIMAAEMLRSSWFHSTSSPQNAAVISRWFLSMKPLGPIYKILSERVFNPKILPQSAAQVLWGCMRLDSDSLESLLETLHELQIHAYGDTIQELSVWFQRRIVQISDRVRRLRIYVESQI